MNSKSFNRPPSVENESGRLEKAMKKLEQIDCNLGTKATMLLVAAGVKPSSTVDIYKHEEDIESVKNKMRDAGLYFDDIEVAPFSNENRAASLTIARSQEAATHLAELFNAERSDTNNIDLGKSLGYPATSTEAYIGRSERYEGGLDPFVERRIPGNLQFMLSKNNWEQELQTAKRWLNVLKEVSPETYQKIIETESSEYKRVPFVND